MDVGYPSKSMSLKSYKKMKIKMLTKEFKIPMTEAERNHMNELRDEYAVDRFCNSIFDKYFEN